MKISGPNVRHPNKSSYKAFLGLNLEIATESTKQTKLVLWTLSYLGKCSTNYQMNCRVNGKSEYDFYVVYGKPFQLVNKFTPIFHCLLHNNDFNTGQHFSNSQGICSYSLWLACVWETKGAKKNSHLCPVVSLGMYLTTRIKRNELHVIERINCDHAACKVHMKPLSTC